MAVTGCSNLLHTRKICIILESDLLTGDGSLKSLATTLVQRAHLGDPQRQEKILRAKIIEFKQDKSCVLLQYFKLIWEFPTYVQCILIPFTQHSSLIQGRQIYPPLSSALFLLHFLLFNNPWGPICVAHIHTGIRPLNGAWMAYSDIYLGRTDAPQPAPINCRVLLSY